MSEKKNQIIVLVLSRCFSAQKIKKLHVLGRPLAAVYGYATRTPPLQNPHQKNKLLIFKCLSDPQTISWNLLLQSFRLDF